MIYVVMCSIVLIVFVVSKVLQNIYLLMVLTVILVYYDCLMAMNVACIIDSWARVKWVILDWSILDCMLGRLPVSWRKGVHSEGFKRGRLDYMPSLGVLHMFVVVGCGSWDVEVCTMLPGIWLVYDL